MTPAGRRGNRLTMLLGQHQSDCVTFSREPGCRAAALRGEMFTLSRSTPPPAFRLHVDGHLGMGLSICRSIIDAHRGRLWVSECSPRGVCVQFRLPRHPGVSS
ncbi:ATP-binding protein [Paraburkholderia youngii]|uniref:ATP-binding protein n=1 Tax=Paraburkholderia youngii TaxID=2782701 RepID=UPI003D1C506A